MPARIFRRRNNWQAMPTCKPQLVTTGAVRRQNGRRRRSRRQCTFCCEQAGAFAGARCSGSGMRRRRYLTQMRKLKILRFFADCAAKNWPCGVLSVSLSDPAKLRGDLFQTAFGDQNTKSWRVLERNSFTNEQLSRTGRAQRPPHFAMICQIMICWVSCRTTRLI